MRIASFQLRMAETTVKPPRFAPNSPLISISFGRAEIGSNGRGSFPSVCSTKTCFLSALTHQPYYLVFVNMPIIIILRFNEMCQRTARPNKQKPPDSNAAYHDKSLYAGGSIAVAEIHCDCVSSLMLLRHGFRRLRPAQSASHTLSGEESVNSIIRKSGKKGDHFRVTPTTRTLHVLFV